MIKQGADRDPPELDWMLPSFSGRLGFDVGANIGQSMEVMSARFDRVICIEPARESYEVLTSRLLSNVTAVQVAATCLSGTVELDVMEHPIQSGQLTSRTKHDWGKKLGTRVVQAATLDDLAWKFGMPDFVKVDVEGHELKVFEGANDVVSNRPGLLIEVHDGDLGIALIERLDPVYGDALEKIEHPHYRVGSWKKKNHWWLMADGA